MKQAKLNAKNYSLNQFFDSIFGDLKDGILQYLQNTSWKTIRIELKKVSDRSTYF